jgi:hypothetical protein
VPECPSDAFNSVALEQVGERAADRQSFVAHGEDLIDVEMLCDSLGVDWFPQGRKAGQFAQAWRRADLSCFSRPAIEQRSPRWDQLEAGIGSLVSYEGALILTRQTDISLMCKTSDFNSAAYAPSR